MKLSIDEREAFETAKQYLDAFNFKGELYDFRRNKKSCVVCGKYVPWDGTYPRLKTCSRECLKENYRRVS